MAYEKARLPKRFIVERNVNGVLHVNVAALCETEEICWAIIRKKPSIKIKVPIEKGMLKYVFNQREHPSGVYHIKIMTEEEVKWEQLIFMQWPPRYLSIREIERIAKKYQPILLFNYDEQYFPMSLEAIFKQIAEIDKIATVRTPFGVDDVPYRELENYMATNGHKESLLRFSHDIIQKDLVGLTGNREDATIYYSYMEDDEQYYINYHFFYGYDSKLADTSHFTLLDIGVHNLDRESMTLVFKKTAKVPSYVITSGHITGQEMALLENSNKESEKYNTWRNGRVKMPYKKMKPKNLSYPMVAIAKGSHAVYPVPGWYLLDVLPDRQLAIAQIVEPAGLMGYGNRENDRLEEAIHLYPRSKWVKNGYTYQLKKLNLGNLDAKSPLYFSGYWIDGIAGANSRFTPFLRREREVSRWASKATPFDMAYLPPFSKWAKKQAENRIARSIRRH